MTETECSIFEGSMFATANPSIGGFDVVTTRSRGLSPPRQTPDLCFYLSVD
jgi:hypothetical protein